MNFIFDEVKGLWTIPVKVYGAEIAAIVDTTLTRTVLAAGDVSTLTGLSVTDVLNVCTKRGGIKQRYPEHRHIDCYPLKLSCIYIGNVKFDTFQCLVSDAFENSHIGLDMLRCMSLAKDSAEKTLTCSEIRCDEYSSVYDKHFKDIGALSNESGNDLQQILEKLASYSITLYDAVTTARKIPGEMRTLVNGFLKMHEKFPMPIADVEVGDTLLHEGAQWVVEKIVMDDGAPMLLCNSKKGVSGWVRDAICVITNRQPKQVTGVNVSYLLDKLREFNSELYSYVLKKQVPDGLCSVVDAFMHEYGMFPMPVDNVGLGDAVLKDGTKYTVVQVKTESGRRCLHCKNQSGVTEWVIDDIVIVLG